MMLQITFMTSYSYRFWCDHYFWRCTFGTFTVFPWDKYQEVELLTVGSAVVPPATLVRASFLHTKDHWFFLIFYLF